MTSRGHCLTININIGHNKLLTQTTYTTVFVVRTGTFLVVVEHVETDFLMCKISTFLL